MPLFLAIVGAALLVTAIRNTQVQLGELLAADVPAFLPWAGAIVVIGVLGYIPEVRKFSHALLALVLIVIMLKSGGGFFSQFADAIKNPAKPAASPYASPASLGPLPIEVSQKGGAGGAAGAAASAAGGAIGKAIGSGVTDLLGGLF